MRAEWVEEIQDQCRLSGIAFFFQAMGGLEGGRQKALKERQQSKLARPYLERNAGRGPGLNNENQNRSTRHRTATRLAGPDGGRPRPGPDHGRHRRAAAQQHSPALQRPGIPGGRSLVAAQLCHQNQKEKNKDKILTEEGRLRRLLSIQAGKDYVEVGSTRIYAGTHQFGARRGAYGATRRGAPIPWGDIPARPFLGVSDGDKKTILEIIQKHLKKSI